MCKYNIEKLLCYPTFFIPLRCSRKNLLRRNIFSSSLHWGVSRSHQNTPNNLLRRSDVFVYFLAYDEATMTQFYFEAVFNLAQPKRAPRDDIHESIADKGKRLSVEKLEVWQRTRANNALNLFFEHCITHFSIRVWATESERKCRKNLWGSLPVSGRHLKAFPTVFVAVENDLLVKADTL